MSALYLGRVMHLRRFPQRYRFDYRVFSLLLDVDTIAGAAERLRLFSYRRFNLVSFHPEDHGPRGIEELEDTVDIAGLRMVEIPREALFLAGKAFLAYRKQGGTRTGVLPDFFIGAHAAVMELPLLTRETARYRTYFPGVELITPGV